MTLTFFAGTSINKSPLSSKDYAHTQWSVLIDKGKYLWKVKKIRTSKNISVCRMYFFSKKTKVFNPLWFNNVRQNWKLLLNDFRILKKKNYFCLFFQSIYQHQSSVRMVERSPCLVWTRMYDLPSKQTYFDHTHVNNDNSYE